jgi:hypothetical protein
MVPLHTTPSCVEEGNKPQYVGHTVSLVHQYGLQGKVARHGTVGFSPTHQLSAITTAWPLMRPLHTTPTDTFEANRPQSAGHCTFCVYQNGAQGGVARQSNDVLLGCAKWAQKLSATTLPTASMFV